MQPVDLFFGKVVAVVGRLGLNQRIGRGDRDSLYDITPVDGGLDRDDRPQKHPDVRQLDPLVAGNVERQGIDAGRQERDVEPPLRVGYGRALPLEDVTGRHDGDAR